MLEKYKDKSNVNKNELQILINKMETQLVHGGHGIEEGAEKEQARKIRQMQLKLKK